MATLPQSDVDAELAAKVAELESIWAQRGLGGVEATDRRGEHGTDRTNKTNRTNAGVDDDLRVGVADLKKQKDWLSRWEAAHELEG